MSTDLSNCSTSFQTDLTQLKKDAAQFEKDQIAYHEEQQKELHEAEGKDMSKYKGNPGALLIFLIVNVYGNKADTAFQLKLKTEADAVQIQADLTKLSNNIHNTINAGGDTTIASGQFKGYDQGIVNVAAELDEMQKYLAAPPASDSTYQQAEAAGQGTQYALNDALGSSSCSLLSGNFAKMRDVINWSTDPNASKYNKGTNPIFDPNPNEKPATGSTTSSYINSFAEMQQDLKIQGDTTAQDGYKVFLDNYNQNVSATQSLGTASNAEIGLVTSKIKSLVSFVSDMVQDTLTGNRTAVKDQVAQ